MAISKKILGYLKKKNYPHEIIEHKTTYTALDTARTTQKKEKKIKPEEIVKALVIKAGKDHLLALIGANKRLDKKKLLKVVNGDRKKRKLPATKSLNLAKEAWMKKNIPGRVGATPPFREFLKLDIYIDNGLKKQRNFYVGSGEYEYSIKIPAAKYVKIELPLSGDFSTRA